MSCAQTWEIPNPHYNQIGYNNHWKQYLEVPCGWCLNCRVDKQNWISDACDYEWKKYNYIASFVTFTYDDIHLYQKDNILPDDFFSFVDDDNKVHVIPFKNNKPAQFSLKRDDARDFLKRLRSKIDYYYKKHKIKNVDLCRKDFKYISCGEYGDLFGRPHYHFIFFGLDYDFCKDIFEECWQQGLIDSLPVKDGAFNYVSKYFTKQQVGKRAVELYDDNGIERPYFVHSLGLGKGLILEQLDFIKSHNACYINKNDILRPIPIYYRNFFHLRSEPNYEGITEQMRNACISSDRNIPDTNIHYSLKKMNQFKKDQALLRHKKLQRVVNDAGEAYEPLVIYHSSSDKNLNDIVNAALFLGSLDYRHNNQDEYFEWTDKVNYIPF